MNTCTTCGYKVIRKDLFAKHLLTHEPSVETPLETPVEVPAPVEVAPIPEVPPVVEAAPEENVVVLKFDRQVELWTNGIKHQQNEKNEIVLKGPHAHEIAADLARRAREAYGRTVLL